MKSNINLLFTLASTVQLTLLTVPAVDAQTAEHYRQPPQQISGEGGGLFMEEEETAPPPRNTFVRPGVHIVNDRTVPRQQIHNNLGNDFMDEVTEASPHHDTRVPIDLRNTNVQVDQKGQIVPMLNRNAGPVQYQYNSGIQAYREMAVPTIAPTYNNPLALPFDTSGRPVAVGTTFVPVAPGMVPGIRFMNYPPGYYYGNNFGYSPFRQTQYSGTYSQTSLTGDSAGLIMPMFRDFDR
jgi:hypothetical protein